MNKSLKNERSDRRYIAMKWHWNQSRRLILSIEYGHPWKIVDRMVLIQLIDFQLFSFCTETHLHHATKKVHCLFKSMVPRGRYTSNNCDMVELGDVSSRQTW